MSPEDIMLSKINKMPKDFNYMRYQNSQIHRDRKQKESNQGLRRGEMGTYCLTGMEFQFGKMEQFQRWIMVMVTKHCIYLMPVNYIPKNW